MAVALITNDFGIKFEEGVKGELIEQMKQEQKARKEEARVKREPHIKRETDTRNIEAMYEMLGVEG